MDFLDNSEIIGLVMRCKEGDNDAFESLVLQYKPMLHSLIRRASLDVDEYFSDACMGLYKAALSYDTLQSEVTFGLYASICVTRCLYDVLRREAKGGAPTEQDVDVDSIAVSDGIVSRLVRREENEELRHRAAELLSDYEYRVFLEWLGGHRASVIAERLSTDVKSVENAKGRILKKLREGMRP